MIAALALLLAVAVALRVPALIEPRFWLDEMISISVAQEGVLGSIIATLRLSSHPPVYYTQLAIWMLGGNGDVWLALNPVLWSLASIGLLIWLGARRLGLAAALAAAALVATLPQMLYAAENVRMYPMMHALSIVAWWCNERYFAVSETPARPWPLLLGLAACQLLVGFSHAVGPMLAALLGLHGLLLAVGRWPPTRRSWTWLAVQLAVGAMLVVVLFNGLLREPQHQPAKDLSALWESLVAPFFDPLAQYQGIGWLLPALVLLLVAIAAVRSPDLRATAIALVVVPMLALEIAVLADLPLPGGRVVALIVPFVALAAGSQAVAWYRAGPVGTRRLVAVAGATMLAVCLLAGLLHLANWEKSTNYRAAAAHLRQHVEDGDAIVVANMSATHWGLARELIGPDWGSAMAVQPPPNERWSKLIGRLGPNLANRLGLMPETDTIDWQGHPFAVGMQAVSPAAPGQRTWLVTYVSWNRDDLAAQMRSAGWQLREEIEFRRVYVALYTSG
ncbi:MAG: hypothetical protein RIM84_21790 [Alphaproteobacteria bacterium]